MKTSALAVVILVGCGGGSSSSPSNAGGAKEPPPAKARVVGVYGGAEYGGYKKTRELTAFRELIAGASASEACSNAQKLKVAATAIQKAPAPVTDPVWKGESTELDGLATDFITACGQSDAAAIDGELRALNASFQRLLKLVK